MGRERFSPVTAECSLRRAAGISLLILGLLAAAVSASASPASPAAVCRYDVQASRDLVLEVRVACGPGVRSLAPVEPRLRRYISVHREDSASNGFTGAYRVDLGVMARREQSIDSALSVGDSVLAVGAAWLLPPQPAGDEPAVLRVRMRMPSGTGFDTGQPVVDGVFEIPAGEIGHAGFSAFGEFRSRKMTAGGDGYRVVVLDGDLDAGEDTLLGWIDGMAEIAARFWRGFPVPGMPVYVVPRPGEDGVPFGRVMAGGGVSLVLYVGEHATIEQLRDDWVLIHELVHVGVPFVPGAPWFLEGLATYFEPLIRARHDLQSPEAMWKEFMTFMPRGAEVMKRSGLARGGFRGWYWGGALLMLMTDVEMRRASGGHAGLEDCLHSIRSEVGDYRRTLGLSGFVRACDEAVGGNALSRLVRRYGSGAGDVDLAGYWRSLGLKLESGRVTYLEDAPLSGIRDAVVNGG